jgi:hypothetical protein
MAVMLVDPMAVWRAGRLVAKKVGWSVVQKAVKTAKL